MKASRVTIRETTPGTDAEVDDYVRKMNEDRPAIALLTSLSDEKSGKRFAHILGQRFHAYRTLDDLTRYANEPTLLSFSTSVIVPEEVFERFDGGAYNLHAASPSYPGRDPHHWATYEGAKEYGATLHVMSKKVDDGPIVDVEMFSTSVSETPTTLLERANEAAYRLLERHAKHLLSGKRLKPRDDIVWAGKKHSRKEFNEMCRLDPHISRDEFERRLRAFDVEAYDNLTVTIHGRIFRLEK